MILYIKWETTSLLFVLTAVQYQHPQQWQDDEASVLLMDTANMSVVMKGLDFSCQPTVDCHITPRSLFHKWNALKGILQHYNLSLWDTAPRPDPQTACSLGGRATVGFVIISDESSLRLQLFMQRVCMYEQIHMSVRCALKMTFPVFESIICSLQWLNHPA